MISGSLGEVDTAGLAPTLTFSLPDLYLVRYENILQALCPSLRTTGRPPSHALTNREVFAIPGITA